MRIGDKVFIAEYEERTDNDIVYPYSAHCGRSATITRAHIMSTPEKPVWEVKVDGLPTEFDNEDYIAEHYLTLISPASNDEFVTAFEYLESAVNAMRAMKFLRYFVEHDPNAEGMSPVMKDMLLISQGKLAVHAGIHPTEWDV